VKAFIWPWPSIRMGYPFHSRN